MTAMGIYLYTDTHTHKHVTTRENLFTSRVYHQAFAVLYKNKFKADNSHSFPHEFILPPPPPPYIT